jgi:cob(I)alamin adenosyltransferase
MGNRLTKIYTRTGDDGITGLGDGKRVDKDNDRLEAIGSVDELNSVIGLVLSQDLHETVHKLLIDIQHELFDLGGELSIPGRTVIGKSQIERLETTLDALNRDLPSLKEFILPGGCPAAALCHTARTVCRRAERRLVTLKKNEPVNTNGMVYLNRLSDLLFVVARHLNAQSGHPDVLWRPKINKD